MITYITVTPAYGRDYKSAQAVKDDWNADKDFIIRDVGNPWSGKPINKPQADAAGYKVVARYARERKVVTL